jgi:hypothetical protein
VAGDALSTRFDEDRIVRSMGSIAAHRVRIPRFAVLRKMLNSNEIFSATGLKPGSLRRARKAGHMGARRGVAKYASHIRALAKKGLNKSAISRRVHISRTSVRRFLARPLFFCHWPPLPVLL